LCGGTTVDATLWGQWPVELKADVPGKFLPRRSQVRAKVCLDCGYAMLFATDPQKFRQQQ